MMSFWFRSSTLGTGRISIEYSSEAMVSVKAEGALRGRCLLMDVDGRIREVPAGARCARRAPLAPGRGLCDRQCETAGESAREGGTGGDAVRGTGGDAVRGTGGDAVKLSNRGNRPCCQDFLLPACGAHDIK
jgi:hypothetical protein